MLGEVVGNFRIIRQLGQGGMGEVWLAEHKEIKTKVAIKMLLPAISQDKQQVQRFFNEAVAVSKIKHAGIAKIFDVGFHTGGEAYLVMEFLEGESLGDRIARSDRIPPRQLADIGRQIASVLEATHAAGITHRDLKPDNVFLVNDAELDSGERVKVLDFGIAKLGGATTGLTGAGSMGTPSYMSPEQWKSSTNVDGRADLYSLGCLAFEMACGRPPFLAGSVGEACHLHLSATPPAARSLVEDLPLVLDSLLARLLAKDPGSRPAVRDVKAAFTVVRDTEPPHVGETLETLGSDAIAPPGATRALGTGGETTLGNSAMAIAAPLLRARSRASWLIAGAVVVLGGTAVAVAVVRGGGGGEAGGGDAGGAAATASAASPLNALTGPAPVSAPTAPLSVAITTSRVQITTTPANAQIRLDDAPVAAPFDGAFPRSDVRHRLDVRAPGYQPSSQWITFEADRALVITLERQRPASGPVKPTIHAATVATPPLRPAPPPTLTPAPADPPAPSLLPASPTATENSDAGRTIYRGTKGTILTH